MREYFLIGTRNGEFLSVISRAGILISAVSGKSIIKTAVIISAVLQWAFLPGISAGWVWAFFYRQFHMQALLCRQFRLSSNSKPNSDMRLQNNRHAPYIHLTRITTGTNPVTTAGSKQARMRDHNNTYYVLLSL
jgi:hypothetical protein